MRGAAPIDFCGNGIDEDGNGADRTGAPVQRRARDLCALGEESIMKITARTNGPLLVEGQVEVVDANGKAYTPKNPTKFALCRCGGSSNKPFCDGTHVKIAFRCPPQPATETADSDPALANWEQEGGSILPPPPPAAGQSLDRHPPGSR